MTQGRKPAVEYKGILVRRDKLDVSKTMHNTKSLRVSIVLTVPVVRAVITDYIQQMEIIDRRQAGKIRFSAISLLFTVSLAYLCGYRSACSMGKFWAENRRFLRAVIPNFPEHAVSHDTIKRTIENLVFQDFTTFFSRLTESLIYESLNDLHLRDQLPLDMKAFFNLVLQEHSLLERTLNKFKRSHDSELAAGGTAKRPYVVEIYGCSARLNAISHDRLEQRKFELSILTLLREFVFHGCAAYVHFKLDPKV